MDRKYVNPWTWQDAIGFSQAVRIEGHRSVLLCSGQTAMSAEGQPQHVNDMGAQTRLVLDNLEQVIRQAGFEFSDIVRLNHYTTDVDRYFAEGWPVVIERLKKAGIVPGGTLLGITRLAFPELMIEIEATVAR